MNISIKIIPHEKQRYKTCGDYFLDTHGDLQFRISKLPDWKYEMLIIVHELIEYTLVKAENIPLSRIDQFDEMFEYERSQGLHGPHEEPGNDPRAPYRHHHQFATKIEKMIAELLKVDWKKYENAVMAL